MSETQPQPNTDTAKESARANDRMKVVKRDGTREHVNLDRIVGAISRCALGLGRVDPTRVAVRTIGGLYDGASTQELDDLSIHALPCTRSWLFLVFGPSDDQENVDRKKAS